MPILSAIDAAALVTPVAGRPLRRSRRWGYARGFHHRRCMRVHSTVLHPGQSRRIPGRDRAGRTTSSSLGATGHDTGRATSTRRVGFPHRDSRAEHRCHEGAGNRSSSPDGPRRAHPVSALEPARPDDEWARDQAGLRGGERGPLEYPQLPQLTCAFLNIPTSFPCRKKGEQKKRGTTEKKGGHTSLIRKMFADVKLLLASRMYLPHLLSLIRANDQRVASWPVAGRSDLIRQACGPCRAGLVAG